MTLILIALVAYYFLYRIDLINQRIENLKDLVMKLNDLDKQTIHYIDMRIDEISNALKDQGSD